MLVDLYLLETYFEESCTAIYEDDLADKYGEEAVQDAIDSGILEHRRIPCQKGRTRCICKLSALGRMRALEMMAHA